MLTPTFVIMVPVVSVLIEPFIYFCLFFILSVSVV